MAILTPRQQEELHKAIVQYLDPLLDDRARAAVGSALAVPSASAIIPHYLEKKWMTVLRLQQRILDLEAEAKALRAALELRPAAAAAPGAKLDWTPQRCTKTFATAHACVAVSVHPTLPVVFGGLVDGAMVAWDLVSDDAASGVAQRVVRAHTRGVNRIATSPRPLSLGGDCVHMVATCLADLGIKVWDCHRLQHVRTLSGHEHTVSLVVFLRSSAVLYLVSRDRTVRTWDLVSGVCQRTFVGHSDWVRDVDTVASAVGDFLLTCSNDQLVRLLHASGCGVALLLGHTHVVERVRFLPLASNAFIDVVMGAERFGLVPPGLVDDEVYATLGYKYCVSAGRDNAVKLWLLPPADVKPHRDPMPLRYNNLQGWLVCDLVGHLSWVKSIEVHPSGRFVLSASDDRTIKVWDLATLAASGVVQCVRTLEGHRGFVNDIALAPVAPVEAQDDHQWRAEVEQSMRCIFASASVDNLVKVWA